MMSWPSLAIFSESLSMGELQEYKTLATTVMAVQWFKNGDHPLDKSEAIVIDQKEFLSEGKFVRRFRHPDIDGDEACDRCGHNFHSHGFIEVPDDGIGDPDAGLTVCPSDYVVTNEEGDTYPTPAEEFEKTYNLRAGYGG